MISRWTAHLALAKVELGHRLPPRSPECARGICITVTLETGVGRGFIDRKV